MEKNYYTSFGCKGYNEEIHDYDIEYATDTEYMEIVRELKETETD